MAAEGSREGNWWHNALRGEGGQGVVTDTGEKNSGMSTNREGQGRDKANTGIFEFSFRHWFVESPR